MFYIYIYIERERYSMRDHNMTRYNMNSTHCAARAMRLCISLAYWSVHRM